MYKHLFVLKTDNMALIITSCCVLHNLCIDNGDSIIVDAEEDVEMRRFLENEADDDVELLMEPMSRDMETDIPTVNEFGTRTSLTSRLRQLKDQGVIKRNEVMSSL
ncbi:hypothetical protein J3Q64DRAFT_1737732 [Phycomyces blakesleeanus]|uniref:DDE Tnp4 domain-containing protein n=1 Tax=Phycomyces blakesleeanus TaxID=4837 RepID=A0ABR3B3E6_PHYBL